MDPTVLPQVLPPLRGLFLSSFCLRSVFCPENRAPFGRGFFGIFTAQLFTTESQFRPVVMCAERLIFFSFFLRSCFFGSIERYVQVVTRNLKICTESLFHYIRIIRKECFNVQITTDRQTGHGDKIAAKDVMQKHKTTSILSQCTF